MMLCLCSDCLPFEWWMDCITNDNGVFTFWECTPENGTVSQGSCSAFIAEELVHGTNGIAKVVIRFVTVHSIAKNETKAFGRVALPLSEIYTDTNAAIARLADGGFYLGSFASPDEVVAHIRDAVDFLIFRPRREELAEAA